MRKLLLSAALLSMAGSAMAAFQKGDQLAAIDLGAVTVTGPNRNSFVSPGWFAGGDYFYHLTNAFAVGGEVSWAKPRNKNVSALGGQVNVGTSADVVTGAVLGRWNLTPQKTWTPYVAAGPGLHYLMQTVTINVPSAPSLGSTTNTYLWKISAVAAVGVDYIYQDWLLGAQARYQTFDSNSGGVAWLARLGYKFGH